MSQTEARFTINATDRTKAAFKSVQSSLQSLSKNLFSAKGAIAGLVGVGGFGAMVSASNKSIDATAKLSDQLGIATEKLSGLQHRAAMSSRGGPELLNRSLETMNQRLADAARGVGPAATALQRLGLSAQELRAASPDQALAAIADRMQGLESATDRASAAAKIFGRQNSEMALILADGSAGLREAQEEAEGLGIAISRMDAAKVEAANDSFDRLRRAIQGVANRISVALAPYTAALADYLTDAMKRAGDFQGAIVGAFEKAAKGAGFVGNALRGLRVTFKALELGARGMAAVMASTFEVIGNIIQTSINGWLTMINGLIKQINRIPGVSMEALKLLDQDSVFGSVSRWAQGARDDVKTAAQELHELAMQEMPGDKIKAFFDNIRERADAAAKEIADRANRIASLGSMDDSAQDEELAKHRDALAKKLQQVESHLMSAEDREIHAYERRLEIIQQAMDSELIAAERAQELKENLSQQHQQRLSEIERQGWTERQRFSALSAKKQTAQVFGELSTMTQGVAQHSRKMFEINKVAAIANAAINTAQGVSKSLANYPWPLAGAMAAMHAAAGAAQVSAIRRTSFQGGGASAAPSAIGTGGGVENPVMPQMPVRQAQQQQGITINIHGDIRGNDAERVFSELKELINDGDHVLIESTSRNGRMITGAA
jgi:DNA-directed RNA polymerase subunit F